MFSRKRTNRRNKMKETIKMLNQLIKDGKIEEAAKIVDNMSEAEAQEILEKLLGVK
jgi:pentatricopeptide repeat protein